MDETKLSKPKKFGVSPLFKRVSDAKVTNGTSHGDDPLTKPNRIALLLDCSGSMASAAHDPWGSEDPSQPADRTPKIEYLKKAVDAFIGAMNPGDTAAALRAFGTDLKTPLTSSVPSLMIETMQLRADGGTPMCRIMEDTISQLSITRAILVSDGDSTDGDPCQGEPSPAQMFKYAEIPVDTVHIGDSVGGEDTLRKIAELTGGIFMKFKDSAAFSKAFKFLTPSLRLQLSAGDPDEIRRLTGADEVR